MEKIVVRGGDNRLVGSVTIEGAKNAVLPLLAATILASEGKTVLKNVPILSDVFTMNQVVRGLNAKVDFDQDAHIVEVDATDDITEEAPYKYVSKMRASIVVLGPILARVGHAKVSMPGVRSVVVRLIFTLKVWKQWGLRLPKQLAISKLRQNACMEPISIWTFLVLGQPKT